MKTRKKLLFPALFLLALLLTLMLTMFELMHSPSGWSIEENRALASAPQVSARSVWDGTLAQDAEAFYKDHIAARRLLLKLDTAIQMLALFRNTKSKLSPLAGSVTDIHVFRSVADNTH